VFLYGNIPKHKAAPLLDAESGSLASPIEPGLPGQDSKTGRRHSQNANSFHPFDSPLYFALCGMIIITWVEPKGKGARMENGEGRIGKQSDPGSSLDP
jgi:hypothetical protein